MDASDRRAAYEGAMQFLHQFLYHKDDGTFGLKMHDADQHKVDPVVYADLVRSLDETNKKIIEGIIDSNLIESPDFLNKN